MIQDEIPNLIKTAIDYGKKGDLKKSINYFLKAEKLLPNNPLITYNLGHAYHVSKKPLQAIKYFKITLHQFPNDLESMISIGSCYQELEDYSQAEKYYNHILKYSPQHPETLANLGSLCLEMNRPKIAIRLLKKALKYNPNLSKAYYNLANTYYKTGQRHKALKLLNKAISIDPKYSQAYNLQGQIYYEFEKPEEAIKSLGEAIKNTPNEAYCYLNLANILKNTKYRKKAITLYQKAIKIMPRFSKTYPHLYMQYRQICAWSKLPKLEKRINHDNVKPFKRLFVPTETPFGDLFRIADPAQNLNIARRWSEAIDRSMKIFNMKFNFIPAKKDRINVGYISADFQFHPVNVIMSPFYKEHDRKKFEIFAYCYGPKSSDAYRKTVEDGVDHFKMIRKNHFSKAARIIYEDKIDILVDLMGYTQNSIVEISALRPAPIQISYLGFPGSMGASFIDYIIADKILIPENEQKFYTEKIIYMPRCYQINHPYLVSNKGFKRSDVGLPENKFIFSSFNRPEKIEPVIFASWMNILKKVEKSILLLWVQPEIKDARNNLLYYTQKHGVDVRRIYFADQLPLPEHLERMGLTDLSLDPMIYSGGHTTSLCSWAGLPVITIKGTHYLSRMSDSILKAMDMDELVCDNLTEYEKLAVKLANDKESLWVIKRKLLKKRTESDFFHTEKNIRYLEQAYLNTFEIYQKGGKPRHINVSKL
ncbi:MAG TPA: tetratricopeptide repeat protein [Patescibacteria group bacterium]|nr:tetratricopeptide repeat protein [Patescibacteria group bacterium]